MYNRLLKLARSKKGIVCGIINFGLVLAASPLWAEAEQQVVHAAAGSGVAWESIGRAFAGSILLAIGALGCAMGMSRIGLAAIEGMARQPEVQGRLFTTMLIGMALIEALCLYCLVVSLMLIA
ncbi:MAG: ATP synthase F0 subunit C [bacterium]